MTVGVIPLKKLITTRGEYDTIYACNSEAISLQLANALSTTYIDRLAYIRKGDGYLSGRTCFYQVQTTLPTVRVFDYNTPITTKE